MKKFMIFGFNDYYPAGGMGDFIDSDDTLESALAFVKALQAHDSHRDNYTIHDRDTLEQVWESH